MERPGIPKEESARLAALRRTGLVDSPIEERFDRITRLVRRSLGVPISVISLVEEDRQFFKSVDGIDSCGSDRDVSFCGHAIHESDFMVVNDALKDPRFCDNPLVTGEPHVRSYAGAVLRTPDGFRVGTLCAIETQARRFTPEDLRTLKDLAAFAELEISMSWRDGPQVEALEVHEGDGGGAERGAMVDQLTRVWDRERIVELASVELDRARRTGRGFALLVVDMDHLAQINDEEGWSTGDAALVAVSRRVLGTLRTTDMMGRLGDDEFLCVLTPCSTRGAAREVAERIRDGLRCEPLFGNKGEINLSASMGIALCGPHDLVSTVPDLIECARSAISGIGKEEYGLVRFGEAA